MGVESSRWGELVERRVMSPAMDTADAEAFEELRHSDPAKAAEARVLEELARFVDTAPSRPSARTEAWVRAALTAAERPAPPRWIGRTILVSTLGLAAAAGLVIWIGAQEASSPDPEQAWRVAVAEGEVRVAGEPVSAGERLPAEADMLVSGGRACVRPSSEATLCLEGSAALRRDRVAGHDQLSLRRGRASVRWSSAAGQALRWAEGEAIPHGPDASVAFERLPDDGLRLTVLTGKVEFASAGSRWIGEAGETVVVGATLREAPADEPVLAPPAPHADAASPAEDRDDACEGECGDPPVVAPELPSPAAYLRRARALRHEARWRDAASTYRRLQRSHPSSPEARISWVSLGDLQLDHLGDPRGAAASYRRYLRGGSGSLEFEARYGMILAYRRLGDRSRERAAIEALLRAHPEPDPILRLRERLEVLR